MITDKTPVRNFTGKIIGWIENCENGDKIARAFIGTILGKYDKRFNVTRKFNGWIIAQGDNIGLLFNDIK